MLFLKVSEFFKNIVDRKYRFILISLSGLLTGLTLIFPKVGFIEWITMIPVCAILLLRATDRETKLRSLYLDGLVFFCSFYIVCYHWFAYLYPLEFVDGMTPRAAIVVVVLAWLGLSLLQALMGGLVFVLAGVFFRTRLCQKAAFARIFIAAGLWAVFEWIQTIGWWGVPWGRLPIGQSEYIVGLQTASLLGSYFITFLLVTLNCLLAYAIVYPPRIKISVIVAVSLLVFQYGVGAILWTFADITSENAIRVACIQGNISSSDKWSADSDVKTTEVYRRLIIQAAEEGAELILLPETAFPYDFDSDRYSRFNDMFGGISKEYGIYIVVGAYTREGEKDSLNSLVCYSPDGDRIDTVYSKRHLVPFGEYVPKRPLVDTLIPPLADLVLSSDDIDPGEGANVMLAGDVGLGGLICFDSIYESLAYESVREGANIICLSTNDSWFSDSAALYMHNAQAQLRAIENGRYVIRAANTGISTVITPRGEIIERLEPLVEGNVYATVYAKDNMTLNTRVGNLFVYFILAGFVIIISDNLAFNWKSSKKSKKC